MKPMILLVVALAMALGAPLAQSASPQRTFASPEEAAAALVESLRASDRAGMLAVLGHDAANWISSGDATADRATVARFIESYSAKNSIEKSGETATLTIGTDGYPFAFPIVKTGERWRFDTAAGKEELFARRIGDNELNAIETLRAVVDAQLDYASEDRNGNGTLEYAQQFASKPGKRDGLYWPAKAGEPPSPLGAARRVGSR